MSDPGLAGLLSRVVERERVLVVEDDLRVQRVLELALTHEGYHVLTAGDGEQALVAMAREPVDVVLLDVMLPGQDGLDVCRQLRQRGDLPVIMVTARSDSRDVVAGLEAGADDYVTKPLVAEVLAARIRALLRRARPHGDRPLTLGPLTVRPDLGEAELAGHPVALTKTEMRLLTELLAAKGGLVTREQLLERVWGYDYFGDTRLLDVHVHRLRMKVEEDPAHPQLVRTVRGLGYRVPTAAEWPEPGGRPPLLGEGGHPRPG